MCWLGAARESKDPKGDKKMPRLGKVSGEVKGRLDFLEQCNFRQGAQGVGVQVIKDSEIWYVDGLKTGPEASGNGSSWKEAFLTLTEAVAAAGDYDVIYVGPGYYSEAAVIDIDQHGLKIFGTGNGAQWGPCGFGSATSEDTILTINANRVEIAGLAFWCLTDAKNGIEIGTTYDSWNTWIHDCAFGTGVGGNTLGEYGIKVNETEDCANTLIENNYFNYLSTAAIVVNATRCTIRNNIIWSSAIGIDCELTGDTRANCAILNNYIIGRGTEVSGDIGIKLNATEATDGTILIANNIVTNFSTNITATKSILSIVNNQTAADATSYLQVDTSP